LIFASTSVHSRLSHDPPRKKLIEVALPLPEINDASAYDKMPGMRPHPKGTHYW
jgi:putative DNA methylase